MKKFKEGALQILAVLVVIGVLLLGSSWIYNSFTTEEVIVELETSEVVIEEVIEEAELIEIEISEEEKEAIEKIIIDSKG